MAPGGQLRCWEGGAGCQTGNKSCTGGGERALLKADAHLARLDLEAAGGGDLMPAASVELLAATESLWV